MLILVLVVIAGVLVWYFWERNHRKTRPMAGGAHRDIELPHTQEWELYHNNFSLCSKKTRVCLSELAIPFKSHHVNLIETGSYENISRQFLKVNPAALVPVLVHNGHPIYESHEQLNYAALHAENPSLLIPEDDYDRKVMESWVHISSLIGDEPFKAVGETAGNAIPGLTLPIFAAMMKNIPSSRILEGLLFHRIKKRAIFFLVLKFKGLNKLPGMTPLVKLIAESREAMHKHLENLEQALALSEGPWIVGQQFTLADVGMMVIFERLKEVDWLNVFLVADRPLVQAYWSRLQQRPSYAAGIENFSDPGVAEGRKMIIELKQSNPKFRQALIGPLNSSGR